MSENFNGETNSLNDYESVYGVENNEPEVGFFKQFPMAFMPQKYGELVHAKKGQMIGFVTILMLVVTIVLACDFFIVGVPQMNKFFAMCPEFSLSNGELSLESELEFSEDDTYFYANDDVDTIEMSDVEKLVNEKGYDSVAVVSKKNLVFYGNGQYQTAKFSDFGNLSIDRDFIVNDLANALVVIVAIGFVCYFIFGSLLYFFYAMCYWLVMMVVSKIFKREVENGYLFKSCVYGKAFMVVIATLISILPISITIPTFGRTMITLAFLVFALSKLPTKEASL